jgi:exonuclease SbcC
MKPLKLTIAGLNSFTEEQTVDFESLSRGGLFGIAGKTGSGKTTVLDAVILALYGSLPGRGKRNADFINLKCGEARVTFLFEIEFKGARKRYLVERRFVRRKGGETRHDARLTDLTGGASDVLESDARGTDARLLGITGLKAEDFCQCIVLQQGEFARFLNLEPAKRIEAIGRIFSLEEYGERLSDRVKKRAAAICSELEGLEGEKKGTGGVTEEAVAACEKEIADTGAALEIQSKERAAHASDTEKLKAQAGKCAEYLQKNAELADLRDKYKRLGEAVAAYGAAIAAAAERKAAIAKRNKERNDALLAEQTALFESLTRADLERNRLNSERERVSRLNLAAAVRADLSEGDACPVCGGVVHKPAGAVCAGDLEAVKRALNASEADVKKYNARNAEITREVTLILSDTAAAREESEIARLTEKRTAAGAEYDRMKGEGKQLAATAAALKAELPEGAEPAALRAAAEAAAEREREAYRTENELRSKSGRLTAELAERRRRLAALKEIENALKVKRAEYDLVKRLQSVLLGKALMAYVAEEQIYDFTAAASERLSGLTNGRFYLEYDGEFTVTDNMSGGQKRGVATLSGGETFLVSLSLALAISESLAAGSDRVMEFFFLDEGFGTLDNDLVDTVMDGFERLRHERLTIGLISHRTELMQRIPSKITVEHASEFEGSRIVG